MPSQLSTTSAPAMPPMPIVTTTMTGGSAFGSRWRRMRRGAVAPVVLDASTKGMDLSVMTCPRTSRATPTQLNTASAPNTTR